jgi:hypothetical protein
MKDASDVLFRGVELLREEDGLSREVSIDRSSLAIDDGLSC